MNTRKMNTMKSTCRLLCLAVALMATATVASANIISNPGFESGDLTDWSTFGLGWRTAAGADALSGTYGLVCDVLDSQTGENWRGVYQNVSVTAGTTYSAGVFIRAVSVDVSSSWLELQWLDSENNVISQLQSISVASDQAFTYMTVGAAVAPAGAVQASVRGIVNMTTLPAAGNSDFHIFDDFNMTAIPEPGSLALLTIGALGLGLRRRLRK